MHGLARHAERLKMEALLDAAPGSLEFLEEVPTAELRALRLALRDDFFDRHHDRFARIAACSKLLPVSVSALIARKALGPLLSARVTAHLPPGNAIAMARHEPVGFLTDVCIYTDPRRVQPMLAGMPEATILAVAGELARRGDAVTMGEMAGYLPETVMPQVLALLAADNALLLRTSLFIDEDAALRRLADLISDAQAIAIMQDADRHGLWPVALYLMQRLDAPRRARFGDALAGQDDILINRLVRAIHDNGLWPAALPILADLGKVSRGRLATAGAVHEPEVIEDIVAAAEAHDLWPALLTLTPLLDDDTQRRLLALPALQQPVTLAHILRAADAGERWADMLPLLNLMDDAALRLMAEIGETLDDAAVQSLLQAAHQHRLWSQALRLTAALSDTQRQRAGRLVLAAGPSMLEGLLRHIARHDEWPLLIDWHDALVPDTRRELLEAACRLGDALVAQWLAALSAQTLNLRLQDTLALCNTATHARVEAAIRRLPEAQQPELLALLASVSHEPGALHSPA